MQQWLQQSPRDDPWSSAARSDGQPVHMDEAKEARDEHRPSNAATSALQSARSTLAFTLCSLGILTVRQIAKLTRSDKAGLKHNAGFAW